MSSTATTLPPEVQHLIDEKKFDALEGLWTKRMDEDASDLPFFTNLLRTDPNAGRRFPSGDVRAMVEAILDLLKIPPVEREKAARDLAAKFAWPRLVPPVAQTLHELVASK